MQATPFKSPKLMGSKLTGPKLTGMTVLSSAGAVLAMLTSPADAAIKTVTTKPTAATMTPGEPVLYDDKACPAGMIAKFTKAKRNNNISKKCVHK